MTEYAQSDSRYACSAAAASESAMALAWLMTSAADAGASVAVSSAKALPRQLNSIIIATNNDSFLIPLTPFLMELTRSTAQKRPPESRSRSALFVYLYFTSFSCNQMRKNTHA